MPGMHTWDESTDLFAHSVIGYAIERLREPKDTRWGAMPAEQLAEALAGCVSPSGVGAHRALAIFRDQLLPACRPMDDPMNLAYVPTAPTNAAAVFDLVVSASSIFGGVWEAGAGAIAAENQALGWLADLAGYPATAGGTFVSGGSAANLSALVTARSAYRERTGSTGRLSIAVTCEAHASVRATANVMDAGLVDVQIDERDRMTGAALRAALAAADEAGVEVFAVAATGGTTNAGAVDELDAIADVCEERGLWLHVDGAYGLAALCAPSARATFAGIERSDSFGLDPHKWLFAPYDCAALVYRQPELATRAHAQHGDYLEEVDRSEWNPSDYAYHLSRRARGLPLWFSLATYGTDAYADAMEATLTTARAFADEVGARPGLELLLEPDLSVVLFRRADLSANDTKAWCETHARAGDYLIVPTRFRGEQCLRVCIVNPRTTMDSLRVILDDLESVPATDL
ncbi:MAG: pyridoxal-dependent decarboxylase [Acidimicrobiales bacterium]